MFWIVIFDKVNGYHALTRPTYQQAVRVSRLYAGSTIYVRVNGKFIEL